MGVRRDMNIPIHRLCFWVALAIATPLLFVVSCAFCFGILYQLVCLLWSDLYFVPDWTRPTSFGLSLLGGLAITCYLVWKVKK
jgi:hypothetical protein